MLSYSCALKLMFFKAQELSISCDFQLMHSLASERTGFQSLRPSTRFVALRALCSTDPIICYHKTFDRVLFSETTFSSQSHLSRVLYGFEYLVQVLLYRNYILGCSHYPCYGHSKCFSALRSTHQIWSLMSSNFLQPTWQFLSIVRTVPTFPLCRQSS